LLINYLIATSKPWGLSIHRLVHPLKIKIYPIYCFFFQILSCYLNLCYHFDLEFLAYPCCCHFFVAHLFCVDLSKNLFLFLFEEMSGETDSGLKKRESVGLCLRCLILLLNCVWFLVKFLIFLAEMYLILLLYNDYFGLLETNLRLC